MVRPGDVITHYLAGRTVRYVHPVGYLLVAAAAFTVIGRALVGSTGAAESDRIWFLLVIPFIAAVSRLCFWRGPYNYAEHLILVLYLSAQVLVILSLLYFGTLVVSPRYTPSYVTASLSIGTAHYVWGYTRTFERRRWAALAAGITSLVAGVALWFGAVLVLVGTLRH